MKRFVFFLALSLVMATSVSHATGHRVSVSTKGSCAIAGVTAEEAQLLALRRARSAAVEKAAGVSISSASLVTDGRLAGDFIKSFSQGYIVKENLIWEPVGQYQPVPAKPPIIEYRVKLDAVVAVPDKARPNLGLHANLNQHIYRAHRDKLSITVRTATPARIAVFNITANDQVIMLYPDAGRTVLRSDHGQTIILPDPKDGGDLMLATLPGHKRNAEALLVVALANNSNFKWANSFIEGQPMLLTAFFELYAMFAPHCEDTILPYEVFTE